MKINKFFIVSYIKISFKIEKIINAVVKYKKIIKKSKAGLLKEVLLNNKLILNIN